MDNIKQNSFQPKQASKEKIFLEAAKHFARKGYHGTSVRDISKAAGVNVALINYHFKSKENLYLEVAKYGTNMLNHEVESARGLELDKFIEQIYFLTTDQSGPAFFVSVILSMFTGGFEANKEFTKEVFLKPSNIELYLTEAVGKCCGRSPDDVEVRKVGHNIMAYLFHKSLIRFGVGEGRIEGFLLELYPDSNETFLAMILDMAEKLCNSLKH